MSGFRIEGELVHRWKGCRGTSSHHNTFPTLGVKPVTVPNCTRGSSLLHVSFSKLELTETFRLDNHMQRLKSKCPSSRISVLAMNQTERSHWELFILLEVPWRGCIIRCKLISVPANIMADFLCSTSNPQPFPSFVY